MARGKWFLPYRAGKLNYEDIGLMPYLIQHDIGFNGDKLFRVVKWVPESRHFVLQGTVYSGGDTAGFGKRSTAADNRKARAKAVAEAKQLAGESRSNPTRRRNMDQSAARELELFIENDGDLYRQQYTPILKNLALKKAKGIYDHAKAVKLFRYMVDRADKIYFSQADPWRRQSGKVLTDTATRNHVADSLARKFEREYDLGNYGNLLPKKYQKNPRTGGVSVRKKAGVGWYLVSGGEHLGVQMTNGDIVGYYATKDLAQKAADRMNEPPVWMPGFRKRHPVRNSRSYRGVGRSVRRAARTRRSIRRRY